MRAGNVGSRVRPDLPPVRAELAKELVSLYEHMGARTLVAAARRISACGYEKHCSELSRYLNGDRLPAPEFIACFHDAAVVAAKRQPPRTKAYLIQLRERAEGYRRCRGCADLGRKTASLGKKNERLMTELAGLERTLAEVQRRAAALPVTSSQGDRQRPTVTDPAVTALAERATELGGHPGPTAAVSMLRDVSRALTPVEKAASVVLFRELAQDDLADALVQIFGRDRDERGVIQVALQLFAHGRADDVAALLRVAAR